MLNAYIFEATNLGERYIAIGDTAQAATITLVEHLRLYRSELIAQPINETITIRDPKNTFFGHSLIQIIGSMMSHRLYEFPEDFQAAPQKDVLIMGSVFEGFGNIIKFREDYHRSPAYTSYMADLIFDFKLSRKQRFVNFIFGWTGRILNDSLKYKQKEVKVNSKPVFLIGISDAPIKYHHSTRQGPYSEPIAVIFPRQIEVAHFNE